MPVGKFVGSFLDWMVTDAGVSLDLLHVMGHSVGAQIAGMVGEHVSVGKVARITGQTNFTIAHCKNQPSNIINGVNKIPVHFDHLDWIEIPIL